MKKQTSLKRISLLPLFVPAYVYRGVCAMEEKAIETTVPCYRRGDRLGHEVQYGIFFFYLVQLYGM